MGDKNTNVQEAAGRWVRTPWRVTTVVFLVSTLLVCNLSLPLVHSKHWMITLHCAVFDDKGNLNLGMSPSLPCLHLPGVTATLHSQPKPITAFLQSSLTARIFMRVLGIILLWHQRLIPRGCPLFCGQDSWGWLTGGILAAAVVKLTQKPKCVKVIIPLKENLNTTAASLHTQKNSSSRSFVLPFSSDLLCWASNKVHKMRDWCSGAVGQ